MLFGKPAFEESLAEHVALFASERVDFIFVFVAFIGVAHFFEVLVDDFLIFALESRSVLVTVNLIELSQLVLSDNALFVIDVIFQVQVLSHFLQLLVVHIIYLI